MKKKDDSASAFESLNQNHKEFVLNYINSRVATTSYIDAYTRNGKSPTYFAAAANATKLLKTAKIQAAIREQLNSIWEERSQSIGRIFDEFIALGFSNIKDVLNFKDGQVSFNDFDEIDTRAVKSVQVKRITSESNDQVTAELVKIEMYDKSKALSELAEILKLKTVQIDVPAGITINLDRQDSNL